MLSVLLAMLAQALPPPAPVDDGPTAFACTLDKIVRGDRCTFEGAAPSAAQSADLAWRNTTLAASASRGCAKVPAGPVRASCERDIAEASLAPECTLGGERPLADAGQRLVPAARACAARLRAALDAAQKMASVSHSCCRCLAQGRCAVPELQCNRQLSELSASVELSACVARACAEECAFLREPDPPETAGSGEPPPQRPASRGSTPKTPASSRAVPGKI